MTRRVVSLVCAVVGTIVVSCAYSRCGGDEVMGTDAAIDAPRDVRRDQVVPDTSSELDASLDSPLSDWPGWKRVGLSNGQCPLDVALDPPSAVPAIKWIPCSDGRANCEEIDGTLFSPETIKFPNGWFSPDGRAFVLATFGKGELTSELDVFDVKTLAPLAAWRVDHTNAPQLYCGVHPSFSETKMGAYYAVSYDGGPILPSVDFNTPAGLMASPNLLPLPIKTTGSSEFQLSDTAFGMDLGLGIVRGVSGTNSIVTTQWPYQLVPPFSVVGSDIYAVNQHGTGDGWYREALIQGGGVVSIFREVSQRHVTAMSTDGKDWYWAESWGSGNPNADPQPNVQIFTSPYSNNPTTVETGKKTIATFPPGLPFESLASPGHYIVQGVANQTDIFRASDGHRTSVINKGTGWCWRPLYATDTEFWCIERLGQNGPNGVKVTKIHLSAW